MMEYRKRKTTASEFKIMLYKNIVLNVIPSDVIADLLKQYKLDVSRSVHGASHWGRVAENALMICATENNIESADAVCIAFAFFHDICRESEYEDHNHGQRGAELMRKYKDRLNLSEDEFNLAYEACVNHTDVIHNDGDVLVSACMDADRLDLGRVGVTPNPRFLNTAFSKSSVIISAATSRSMGGYCPKWMKEIMSECDVTIF